MSVDRVVSTPGTSVVNNHAQGFLQTLNSWADAINTLLGDSEVYYVDPVNGSDLNDGSTPDLAFATLQAGIDACTDSRGDFVVRMPGTENPTAAINFNKEGITVVASNYGGAPAEKSEAGFATYPDASYTSGPMGIISKPCTIMGLEFVTRNTSSGTSDDGSDSGGALCFIGEGGGEAGSFSYIKDCRFVDWYGNDWGIDCIAGSYNTIEGCTFEGFTAGINFQGSTSNNPESFRVVGNWFKDCTYGIEHTSGTPHNFLYADNYFVDSKGLNSNAANADGLVAGNWFETATDAATYDDTVATLQGQNINFCGNHYSE